VGCYGDQALKIVLVLWFGVILTHDPPRTCQGSSPSLTIGFESVCCLLSKCILSLEPPLIYSPLCFIFSTSQQFPGSHPSWLQALCHMSAWLSCGGNHIYIFSGLLRLLLWDLNKSFGSMSFLTSGWRGMLSWWS
jgi:hypothetical protein